MNLLRSKFPNPTTHTWYKHVEQIKYNCDDNITTTIMLWQVKIKISREIQIDMLNWCWAKCLENCKKWRHWKIDWSLFSFHSNCSQFFLLSLVLVALNNKLETKEEKKTCKLKKTKALTNEKTKDTNTNNFTETLFCRKGKTRRQIYLQKLCYTFSFC